MVSINAWALIVLFGSLAVSGYYRAVARRRSGTIERRREGGLVLAARAAGGLGAFGAVLVHALAPATMRWASFQAPAWLIAMGAFLGALAVPATYWVFSSIGSNVSETVLTKRDHALVERGPYRWIRHPLYTLGSVLLLSLGLMLASWLVLGFAAAAFVVFRFVVVPVEERHLVQRFGESYRSYMRRTGAMLPRMTPPRS
jgi:protein-S-isoprenylcysteine O-methyltransferase Ste14